MNFFIDKFYCKSKRVHCRGVSRISSWGGGGGALKKIAPSGGRREHFWGISCDFTPINHIFSNVRGGGGGGTSWIRPCIDKDINVHGLTMKNISEVTQ